jgi:hypothetical protein
MKHVFVCFCIGLLMLTSITHAPFQVNAMNEPMQHSLPPVSQKLLQTYLQSYEINAEIERLELAQRKLSVRIADTEQKMTQLESKFADERERAGALLRAYYTGERDTLWLSILAAESFTDALDVIATLALIYENELQQFEQYLDIWLEKKALRDQLRAEQTEFSETRARWQLQQTRVSQLQRDLEQQLAQQANAAHVKQQLKTLASLWQNTGMPLFHQYFRTMARTMAGLPEYLMARKQFRGTTFTIKDAQINDYLRKQDAMFQNTLIAFQPEQIVVSGQDRGVSVRIVGGYQVEQEPENVIRFRMKQLSFQNIELPDTTMEYLTKVYDLNLYTKDMNKLAGIKSITIKEGEMDIRVRLRLGF